MKIHYYEKLSARRIVSNVKHTLQYAGAVSALCESLTTYNVTMKITNSLEQELHFYA